MKEGITRIGVSLPKNLLDEFDEIVKVRGYSSRSEAIRDAIRGYISEYKWLESEKGEVIGVLTVLYDHTVRGVSDALVSIQHSFSHVITSNMHLHLSDEHCLEIIVLKGNMEEIKKLVDKVSAIRGVLSHKMITAQKKV